MTKPYKNCSHHTWKGSTYSAGGTESRIEHQGCTKCMAVRITFTRYGRPSSTGVYTSVSEVQIVQPVSSLETP